MPSKALFPDAPVILKPSATGHSVLAASIMNASVENTKAHNAQIDKNWNTLKVEQSDALERQNKANLEGWRDCHMPPPPRARRRESPA